MSDIFIDDKHVTEIMAGTNSIYELDRQYSGDDLRLTFRLYWKSKDRPLLGRVTVQDLPDQPWAMSCDLWVADGYRGSPIVDMLDRLKIQTVKDSGKYGLIASVHASNVAELKRVLTQGWKSVWYGKEHHLFILPVV